MADRGIAVPPGRGPFTVRLRLLGTVVDRRGRVVRRFGEAGPVFKDLLPNDTVRFGCGLRLVDAAAQAEAEERPMYALWDRG